jgi:hypothetical protein
LIGWSGKVLAEHPDQRRALRDDQAPAAQRDRGDPALRAAGDPDLPLRDARRVLRRDGPGRRDDVSDRLSQPRSPRSPDGDELDIHRRWVTTSLGYGIHCPAPHRAPRAASLRRDLQPASDWDVDLDNAVLDH